MSMTQHRQVCSITIMVFSGIKVLACISKQLVVISLEGTVQNVRQNNSELCLAAYL